LVVKSQINDFKTQNLVPKYTKIKFFPGGAAPPQEPHPGSQPFRLRASALRASQIRPPHFLNRYGWWFRPNFVTAISRPYGQPKTESCRLTQNFNNRFSRFDTIPPAWRMVACRVMSILYCIWEFIYFVWGLSPPKRRVVRRRNFARGRAKAYRPCPKHLVCFISKRVVVTKKWYFPTKIPQCRPTFRSADGPGG